VAVSGVGSNCFGGNEVFESIFKRSNMAVQAAQQIADLKEEVARLQAKLQTNTKQLILVTLIPKWAGTVQSGPLDQFFEGIENTGEIWNWSTEGKVRVGRLKVTGGAKAFLNTASEITKTQSFLGHVQVGISDAF
jgi:hypothetical protein